MDIRKIAVEETSILHLLDAGDTPLFDGKDKPVTVTLCGPGSKTYAKAQAARNNRVMEKLRKKGKADQTADQIAAENAEFLSACTIGMDNIEYDKLTGDALFKAVYSDISIGFIAEQVGKHLGDWANFTKAAPKA
jgi:hypothetical protein